jgi:glycosyltransferase involved in cell wall biosynthesis
MDLKNNNATVHGQADIDLSIVMPVFNEEEALPSVLEEAMSSIARAPFSCEFLLCDDGSSDRSPAILDQWRKRHPNVIRILRHEKNQGIAAACRTLFGAARGKYVFLNASDGQWKTADCLDLMAVRDRYDLVIATRRKKRQNYTLWRSIVSDVFNLMPLVLFGVRTYDAGSNKLYKAELLQIPLISRSVFAEAERIIRSQRRGFRVGAVDVDFYPRAGGHSTGVRFGVIVRSVADLFRCWWRIMICRDW